MARIFPAVLAKSMFDAASSASWRSGRRFAAITASGRDRTAERLGNDAVDDLEVEQVLSCDLPCWSRRFLGASNRATGSRRRLPRDHRIDGV